MAEEQKLNGKGILKGIIFSVLATVACMAVLALVCYFGNISDKLLGILVFAATILCVFTGALFVSRNAQKSGLVHGALLGLGYFLAVFIVSLILQKKVDFDMHLATLLMGDVAAGMLGGVFGINAKNS